MLPAVVIMPLLLSIPLHSERSESVAIVIVHQSNVVSAPEGVNQVRGFVSNGSGGFIAAARATDKRWGYLSERGEWIVPPNLDDARSFSNNGLARFCKDGKWGYLNVRGEIAIRPQYDEALAFDQGLAAVKSGDEPWRFIDGTGNFAFDGTFVAVGSFGTAELAAAAEDNGTTTLWGYIDRLGKWVIKPRFKSALPFSAEGVAPASLDNQKYGLIDRKGNWVLPPEYPNIRKFNEEGLAYFDQEEPWENGHGYLNASGQVIIKGGRGLSSHMAAGVVRAGSASDGYLTKLGKALAAPRLSWAGHFNNHGFAVVRTADFAWSEALNRHEDTPAQWGILRNDGSFVPAPEPLQEPLTNAEGWIPELLPDTPLVPFLTADGQVAFLDRDGKIPYRVRYENNRAYLLDAQGATLWQSSPVAGCRAPSLFFQRPIESFLDRLDSVENVVQFAEAILRETEEKLHRFAAGERDLKPEPDADNEDSEEHDGDDEEKRAEAGVILSRRLVRAYVSEEHNGEYEFLGKLWEKTVAATKRKFIETLIGRFGVPDPDPEYTSSNDRLPRITTAWPVSLKKPVSDDAAPMPEAGQLWLGFFGQADSGDGDEWDELWFTCAPSIDALEAARRRRSAATPSPSLAATVKAENATPPMPQTYEEWRAAVQGSKYAIAAVPAGLLDDGLVDAAIEANVDALEYVPAPWQTDARLEALIRKGAQTAARIPPKCMTPQALALARSLYAREPEWRIYDEERSVLPANWGQNCLYNVWGGILEEEHCIRAVSSGESLQEIPHWLRTPRVEQAALEADIYNISYIAKERITRQLAARAVRHSYGKLIEHIPAALLTPELCMISARTNGLSLEHIPVEMRSVDVCVAALQENSSVLSFVPPEHRVAVSSRLIQEDLESARQDGETRSGSQWHVYRAWLKLKAGDHQGAIDDARLALEYVRYPQTAHYILASAYRALGRRSEAALEASTVLSLENPFKPEFDEYEDTRWLLALSKGQFDEVNDATIIERLKASPRALADVPRVRITEAMVQAALTADPAAIEFVPKRFMTPERYVIALRNRTKAFESIPPKMMREETCIELVRENGYALAQVPEQMRTVKVCAYALRDTPRAIEDVPIAIRPTAQEAVKSLPPREDE